jgi:hypothetical protein
MLYITWNGVEAYGTPSPNVGTFQFQVDMSTGNVNDRLGLVRDLDLDRARDRRRDHCWHQHHAAVARTSASSRRSPSARTCSR